MPRITKSLFRMPAEWERQQSTLIGWPYNKNDWPGKFNNIPKIFAEIISKITKSQKVKISLVSFMMALCQHGLATCLEKTRHII